MNSRQNIRQTWVVGGNRRCKPDCRYRSGASIRFVGSVVFGYDGNHRRRKGRGRRLFSAESPSFMPPEGRPVAVPGGGAIRVCAADVVHGRAGCDARPMKNLGHPVPARVVYAEIARLASLPSSRRPNVPRLVTPSDGAATVAAER